MLQCIALPSSASKVTDHAANHAWIETGLVALARDEDAKRRPRRLTEPGRESWERFRGHLNDADFVELLFEDAAVSHPFPFDAAHVGVDGFAGVPDRRQLSSMLLEDKWKPTAQMEPTEYVTQQARRLGLPHQMARSKLHVVKAHERVLELPGSGGQLSHYLLTKQDDISLKTNFIITCEGWAQRVMAGLVALERGAINTDFIFPLEAQDLANPSHPLRSEPFDFVIGLRPEKGGAELALGEQLHIWFSTARILLV